MITDSSTCPSVSTVSRGTENETWTFSRLPKVPRQALSRTLPISVTTSWVEASMRSGSAGSLVSSS